MAYSVGDEVLGGWRIERLIGEGAFGAVYEVEKPAGAGVTRSALKVISISPSRADLATKRSEGMNDAAIEQYYLDAADDLMNEVSTLAELAHPNVVYYQDHEMIRHTSDLGYDVLIRMELLECLGERLQTGSLPTSEIVRIGTDIAEALAFCHERGIVHRDVKPQNVFIDASGHYKLGDFGISRTVADMPTTLSQKGTLNYMAPELAQGRHADKSVDVYSLGIMLYQLLNNNRLPFCPNPPAPVTKRDEDKAKNRRLSGEDLPEIADCDPALLKLVMRATSYAPTMRPSATELRDGLKQFSDEATRVVDDTKTTGAVGVVTKIQPLEEADDDATKIVDDTEDGGATIAVDATDDAVIIDADTKEEGGATHGHKNEDEDDDEDDVVDVRRLLAPLVTLVLLATLIILSNNQLTSCAGTGSNGGGDVSGEAEPKEEPLVAGVDARLNPSDYTWTEFAKLADALVAAGSKDNRLDICKAYGITDSKGHMRKVVKELELSDGTKLNCQLVSTGYRNGRLAQDMYYTGLTFMCWGKVEDGRSSLVHRYAAENGVSWSESELRDWLNTDVMEMLPSDLAESIVLSCPHGGSAPCDGELARERGEEGVDYDLHGDDFLWAPSARELGGTVDFTWSDPVNKSTYDAILNEEGEWFSYYSGSVDWLQSTGSPLVSCDRTENSAISTGDYFWLRTLSPSSGYPLAVNKHGELGYPVDADTTLGVAFCFNLGDSTMGPSTHYEAAVSFSDCYHYETLNYDEQTGTLQIKITRDNPSRTATEVMAETGDGRSLEVVCLRGGSTDKSIDELNVGESAYYAIHGLESEEEVDELVISLSN